MIVLGRLAVFAALVAEPVAAAGDRDDLGVVQEAVEDGRGAGNVADQFAPIFQRPDKLPPRNPSIQAMPVGLQSALLRCWNWRNGVARISNVLMEGNHV